MDAASAERPRQDAPGEPRPLASVVVVTYDSEPWIRGCLRALEAQDAPFPYEIVVVDNGSKDATRDVVAKEFPSVRLETRPNLGFGAGNNHGARVARGVYLAFVNPDTRAHPLWLAGLVRALEEGADAATSKVLLMADPGRVNTCGNVLHFTGFSAVNGLDAPREAFRGTAPVPGLSGAAFAMRRDAFLEVGGFDEEFFLYLEDTELSWRLRRAGKRIVLAAESEVEHSYAFRLTPGKLYHVELGRRALLRKHLGRRERILYAPGLLVGDALALVLALRAGPGGLAALRRARRESRRRWSAPAGLPPLRLSAFTTWRIPFGTLAPGWSVRAGGWLVNAAFWVCTAGGWRLAPRRAAGGRRP